MVPSGSKEIEKTRGRPEMPPVLGYSKSPLFLTVFGVPVLKAYLSTGNVVVSPIRCVDAVHPEAKTRTIHTDAGRIKVPADCGIL